MILVIGGMGFIGLHTTLRLVEAGHSVVITHYSTRRVPEALEPHLDKDVSVERLDVTDAYNLFDVLQRRGIDSIINLMAPPARATTPAADYRLYTVGLQNVMEAARTFGVKRVCLGSSVAVYAGFPTDHSKRMIHCPWTHVPWWRPSRRAWRPTPSTTPPCRP